MEVRFSKQDMVRFGNYLLSRERNENVLSQDLDGDIVYEFEILEYIKQFHDYNEIITGIQSVQN